MGNILKLIIGLCLLSIVALFLSGCETTNNIPDPKPTTTYEICNTPDCGDNVNIEVE